MNWLQKIITAQVSIESILNAVALGNMNVPTALQTIQQSNLPAPECCETLMAMYRVYPQGQRALQTLSNMLRCQDMTQDQNSIQTNPQQNPPIETGDVSMNVGDSNV
jgi:hypothetical protein